MFPASEREKAKMRDGGLMFDSLRNGPRDIDLWIENGQNSISARPAASGSRICSGLIFHFGRKRKHVVEGVGRGTMLILGLGQTLSCHCCNWIERGDEMRNRGQPCPLKSDRESFSPSRCHAENEGEASARKNSASCISSLSPFLPPPLFPTLQQFSNSVTKN